MTRWPSFAVLLAQPHAGGAKPGAAGRRTRLLLGGLVLLALGLRLWAPPWVLPNAVYTDEPRYIHLGSRSAAGLGDDRSDYRNPTLFWHLLGVEYRLLAAFSGIAGDPADADATRGVMHLQLARLTVAILGAGSVALLYLVGQRAFGPPTGLLAAATLSVNLLHVHLSHFSLDDVPAGFLMLAAMLPGVGVIGRPTVRGLLLAGFFGGLAAGTKYNFGIVLLMPVAACALHAARRGIARRALFVHPLLIGLGASVGFLVAMPETLWSFGEVSAGILRQSDMGDDLWFGQEHAPSLLLYGKTLARAFGFPALLMAVCGLAVALRRRSAMTLMLASVPLVYLAYMGGKALFFARLALPLVPFGCLFAASALACASAQSGRTVRWTVIAGLLCLVTLGPPALLAARLSLLTGQTDTRLLAERWVRANVPEGTPLAAQGYSLPIRPTSDSPLPTYAVTGFKSLSEADQFFRLACARNRYVLIASFRWDRERTVGRPGRPTGYELLQRQGRLVQTFWPGPGDRSIATHIDDFGLPFWHLEEYERPGPTIRLYELPPRLC